MTHKERKTINHIKNYIRQQEQRLATYKKAISKYDRCRNALIVITEDMITDLNALLKWYKEKII